MCVPYKGVNYNYAFEFKVPIEGLDARQFDIAISNYRDETQDFSGLCLNNEFKVVSGENVPYLAFFDIIEKIIKITIQSEKDIYKTSPEQGPVQLKKVESPDFIKLFEENKKSKKSLNYYEKLKIFFESPETITADIPEETKLDLCDYPNMILLNSLIRAKAPTIKDINYFRL